jgi:Flp pilus assembly CpaE family ATPase
MLHINETSEYEDTLSNDSIDLLQKVGNNNDYLLIDLPFKPTAFIRSTLSNSDLIIITSDYKLNDLCEITNTVDSIRFLGIAPNRLAVFLIDPEGTFPGLSLGSLKPFIEANLGITLAGAISLDAKLYQLTYLDSPPIIQSSPSSQLANSIRQIAQYILAQGFTKQQPFQSVVKTSYLEKS